MDEGQYNSMGFDVEMVPGLPCTCYTVCYEWFVCYKLTIDMNIIILANFIVGDEYLATYSFIVITMLLPCCFFF